MKTPTYEISAGALAAMFASRVPFYKADCYTWTFQDGTVLRATDADINLSYGGNTFISCAPAMNRTKVTLTVGVEVNSVDVTILPAAGQTVNGVAWPPAARLGYLDGATLLVETAYLTTWPTVIGALHVFQGQTSDAYPDRTGIKVTTRSALELLAQQFPRNVYQSVCSRTVYDTGCGVAKASFTFTSTIVSSPAPTATSFKCSLAQAAGYFDLGVVTFTSGANAGLKRTVKAYDGAGGFTFALPLPVAPSAGDTISVFAGCDKLYATCNGKFSNAGKFRGFPWIPTPEQATPPIAATTTQSGK